MRFFKPAGVWLLFVFAHYAPLHAAALWFADRDGIHQLDPSTNTITRSLALPEKAVSVPVNPSDNSAWAVTAGTVTKFSTDGTIVLQLSLQGLAQDIGSVRVAALDIQAGNLWLSGERRILQLGTTGQLLATALAPDAVQAIAVSSDRSLWVLGTSTLFKYTPDGQLAAQWSLASPLQQSRFIVIDAGAGAIWLAGSKQVFKLSLGQPQTVLATVATSEVVSGIALDAASQSLWVSGAQNLFRYDRAGVLQNTTPLRPDRINQPTDLAFDFSTQSLWLGHAAGMSRFTAQGSYITTIPVSVQVDALGKTLVGLPRPSVILISPAAGSTTNNALPTIHLGYDALCGGVSCGFPASSFAAYSLSAQLNGQDVSSLFAFDASLGGATYTPASRLPEGLNGIAARVTDATGQTSDQLNGSFTVDTIAPQFTAISPANGSAFDIPQITLQGQVNDVLASISVTGTGTGASTSGPSFSFPLTLQAGSSLFTLTAKDAAGNQTGVNLSYLYQPFSLTVVSPVDGATIDSDSVTVTGTFSAEQNVTVSVNGISAAVSGNSFTASNVPLQSGANTIAVSAKAGSGATATRTLSVTSTYPHVHITSPTDGASFSTDRVLVTGTVQAPANSGVIVNGVVAVVSGTQFFASNVPLSLGVNTVTATATSPTGKQAVHSITATSNSASAVQISATPIQGIAPLTVSFVATSTGNPVASWQANPGAAGSLDTSDPSALFKFTYTQPGVYQASVRVTDSAGQVYTQTIVIGVADTTQMDLLFRSIWSGLNTALVSGDKGTAMSYLTGSARDKYGPVFNVLLPYMPDIVTSYSPLKRGSISQNIGEYAVIRNDGALKRAYFVYFVRDSDGVWRVDEM